MKEGEHPFLWEFVCGGEAGGSGGGDCAVDIRIRIIIQLKGYSPPHSLKGGDEQLQAYHSIA